MKTEAVVLLAPFCKKPIRLTLRGVTNDRHDPTVDIIKTVTIPLVKKFVVQDEGLDLKLCNAMSPAICNRVVDAARSVLNQFVSDLYIYTDHCKGAQSENHQGLASHW
ncbi:rRNA-processing endoribonuclease [Desmophyllum pertusum]|uniref:rRNA-processing endoribonuclease n=1 Tax=Desmophyllum pertusum TaxID=174260 RepID=A0A9W9Z0U5_9CNID|nr:rRNA-processing endoribonuclease [Desmophyllum pertusum]